MHDDQVVLLSRLKPPDIPHAFGATQVDGFTNFLKQLERVLSASGRFEQFNLVWNGFRRWEQIVAASVVRP